MTYADEIAETKQKYFAELYKFTLGLKVWRYTSFRSDVEYGGNTYLAVAIGRNENSREKQFENRELSVSMPLTGPALRFAANAPIPAMWLVVTRIFLHDPTLNAVFFRGRAQRATIDREARGVKLTFAPASALFRSKAPKFVHQSSCNHKLFDSGCGLDSATYKVDVTGATVSGNDITHSTFASYATGYFNWGYVVGDEGIGEMIVDHIGDTISLRTPLPSEAAISGAFSAYPGCDKNYATCRDKYSNLAKFLGMTAIPSSNIAVWGIKP